MKNLKVIIYDCDGVLVNSLRANEAYYNHILRNFSLPPLKPSELALVQTRSAREIIDALFEGTGLTNEAQRYQSTLPNDLFADLVEIKQGAREVLTELRKVYRTALVTNRGKSLTALLRRHRLDDLFDLVVSALDVKRTKPHPEALLTVLDYFAITPDEAIYIGDSGVDRRLCEEAAVPFIAYGNKDIEARYRLERHFDIFKLLATAKCNATDAHQNKLGQVVS
ncbi:MAG: HAD family hydrolase [Syntrophales bacterium LBB04]|nr:HAD family hydrolase [Syntrophales bacterium LBB04]